MISQTFLPHWQSRQPITYTDLVSARDKLYSERGPGLIVKIRRTLKAILESDTREPNIAQLAILNQLSLDLGAINPSWSDFSVAVFHGLMAYNQLSVRAMIAAFENTWKKLND